ncbi:MAG: CDP-alcohol phosphatidyltransferase family protein [Deltaproteobacteria bacterium]|nr:CDP-alcohol phosphatidyltransferase family protein [Deltaproteobacteria bacterium]MBW2416954.1 CDP-alcohol phosphatidyltransferase family protein [Deltaproteobacteria bacterium]
MEDTSSAHDIPGILQRDSGKGSPAGDGQSGLDRLVVGLVRRGVTPNGVSWAGFVCAALAALCLVRGAGHALPLEGHLIGVPSSWWPFAAAFFLLLSSIADLLDGAVARRGGLMTHYGALLDSTLDRFADMALFSACALYFASAGNLTYVLLACAGLAAAVQTSYVKARGENMTEGLGVGFWQRGERIGCLGVGAVTGHMATSLWLLGIFPFFTVARRVLEARRRMEGGDAETARPSRWMPWRQSRRTLDYRIFVSAIILLIFVSPWLSSFFRGLADPLSTLLGRVS